MLPRVNPPRAWPAMIRRPAGPKVGSPECAVCPRKIVKGLEGRQLEKVAHALESTWSPHLAQPSAATKRSPTCTLPAVTPGLYGPPKGGDVPLFMDVHHKVDGHR